MSDVRTENLSADRTFTDRTHDLSDVRCPIISSPAYLARCEAALGGEPTQLWGPHVRAGSVTLFIGQASAGKTVFLHNLAFHLAEGKEFLSIAPVRPYKVLYLDFESNEEIVVEHLRGIGSSERWHFFDPTESMSPGPALVELLDQMVRKEQFDVVIIDPLIEAYPVKDENDNTSANIQMLAFRGLARNTGAGVILVHNSSTKKHRGGTAQGLSRGASARVDRADVVINFSSANETTRKLNVVKSRTYNFGDEFKIQFSGDFGYEVLTAPAGSDAASTKRQSDILAFVENQNVGQITLVKRIEILNYLEMEDNSAQSKALDRGLQRLIASGRLKKQRKGVYSLPSREVISDAN